MLTSNQIDEIKEHLERAQNPVFFFDNDTDGLCSFLLLRRWLGRGKGVSVKSYPDFGKSYFKKALELNADYIFILDKPIVSQDFFEEALKFNLPIVWIDHHDVQVEIPDFVNYYNPVVVDGSSEPVTALVYQITKRKEDLWIAVAGCVADSYLPDFYEEFRKKWPELSVEAEKPFDVLFNSEIGKVARICDSGLKDTTTNVVAMLKFLITAKSPYDVLEENSKNYLIHKRFDYIDKKYKKIFEKAKKIGEHSEKLLFFKYAGNLSLSGELANELRHNFQDKMVVVAYINGDKVNLSGRGKNIRKFFLKALDGLEGSRGGGHENAVGGNLRAKDLDEFKKRLEKLI